MKDAISLGFLVLLCACQIPTEESDYIRAAWIYGFDDLSAPEAELDLIQAQGINTLYFSVNTWYLAGRDGYDAGYEQEIRHLLEAAEQRGIAVHATVMEQPEYTLRANHDRALEESAAVLRFNVEHPEASFAGIHLDTGPHALPDWQAAGNDYSGGIQQGLVQQLHELFEKTRGQISGEVELSAALPWWFDSLYVQGKLPAGNPELWANSLDCMVIMAYSPALPPAEQALTEVEHLPVVVGLDLSDRPSSSIRKLHAEAVDAALEEYSYYRGTAYFHWGLLR